MTQISRYCDTAQLINSSSAEMATGRVFWSCQIIFIFLLVLSTALRNRPCKYSCRGNKSLWCQLNAADAKDGLDFSGLPLQNVFTNVFRIGSHVGFGDEEAKARLRKESTTGQEYVCIEIYQAVLHTN